MKQKDNYKFVTKEDVTYLVFSKWAEDTRLAHGFTTKFGGVSSGELTSLNLGFNRGDDKENVVENYKRVARALKVPFDSLVLSKQVHELCIEKVGAEEKGNGIITPNKWESMDGFYTNEKGVTLVTHYADCVPLFFYAPEYGMIGMAHAGWRGTVGEIGKKMIELWTEKENIPVEAIQVAIGPSIGKCCFEVGEDVASVFKEKFGTNAAFIKKDDVGEKYHIDLWECNKQSLRAVGLKPKQILVSGLCTCCLHDLFFSHRYTKGHRGTLGAFMSLQ